MMKSSDIRKAFIDYFIGLNHHWETSSSLVPNDDPTLLFTNAGMVPFKEVFLGTRKTPYTKAVTVQKCLRAGGKHNDLENVGYTARHHTFFEMLGNFSFGDYFKREAIHYAWDFLTKVLQLPAEKLWITVYKDDQETADIWLNEIKVSSNRFSYCDEKDNFWSMGDTGPCGPCTEIFYDHGPSVAGGPPGSADAEGDRFIEIWNLVFMQFNRDDQGNLHDLPRPSVDTGMGLERITAVIQKVHNNYHIDSFQTLIQSLSLLAPNANPEDPSLKVIADHIRAAVFLIADGVNPAAEGQGYVLRRIIRRAIRHGNKLGLDLPFFYKLVSPLVKIMQSAYPQLTDKTVMIEALLKQEEQQFAVTLTQGLELLKQAIAKLEDKVIPGAVVFKLYDTYGFPVDLTADIARELNLSLNLEEFNQSMQAQRSLSKANKSFNNDYLFTAQINHQSEFKGYQTDKITATIISILVNGKKADGIEVNQEAMIILDKTPFYPESGGQVGDIGIITREQEIFEVKDCKKIGQAILHHGRLKQGKLEVGQTIVARIDTQHRNAIRLNHTATHLVHAALKEILGVEVAQKGSLVEAANARFDFSYAQGLTQKQLDAIETLVNQQIQLNQAVTTQLMNIEEAKKSGAMALFNEKYAEVVRVLSIGSFSKELCGGTHASYTGELRLFKITNEYGVANNIRRLEWVTGDYALYWINQQLHELNKIASLLKTSSKEAFAKLSQFLHDHRQLEKELVVIKTKAVQEISTDLQQAVQVVKGINILIHGLEKSSIEALRMMLDQLKNRVKKAVIVLFAIKETKLTLIVSVSKELLGTVPNATDLIKYLGSKGGGRPDMAQGGGELPTDWSEKIAKLPLVITKHLH